MNIKLTEKTKSDDPHLKTLFESNATYVFFGWLYLRIVRGNIKEETQMDFKLIYREE